MKTVKLMSHSVERFFLSSFLLLSFYCSTVTVQGELIKSTNAAGRVAYTPKPVESITVDGVTHGLDEAKKALLQALPSDNDKRKVELLRKMAKFRQKLKGDDLILLLKREFKGQSDAEVRWEILKVVQFSKDPSMVEFCHLAKDDPNLRIRSYAGAWLIDNGHIEGFGALTSALPGLSKDQRLKYGGILFEGINQMQIPFVDSKGTLRPKPQNGEEALVYLDEWSKWWKKNGAEVLKNSKINPAQTREIETGK